VSPEEFVRVGCQHCGNHIEFPAELLGSSINCPHCNGSTTLAGESTVPSIGPAPSYAYGLEGIQILPVPVPHSYRAGLLLAAALVVLLPVVYLGLVTSAAWWTWIFALRTWSAFADGPSNLGGILYLVPLMVGLIVLLFLLGPLAIRRVPPPQALALNSDAEPVLFEFISQVCQAVGAPKPTRIDLDCQLNAAAGFRVGAGTRREFVLTIGLPLVAGLDIRQFAGVLAHEFGHFTQKSGMRLSYFVRRVQLWFEDLVHARNPWDDTLEEGLAGGEPNYSAFLAKGLIGLTRVPLRIMFFLSRASCSYLMRQMEFDADRYEIEIAGSQGFEETMRRLRVLRRAVRRSYDALGASWQQHRAIPDDFPAFILQQEAQLPLALRARLERSPDDGPTKLMASHPSDADRVERARRVKAPGVIRTEGPASGLFGNFEVVSRQVTHLHYTEDLGIPAIPGLLAPVQGARP
jgi:Zn-dependent protease with chaperone function